MDQVGEMKDDIDSIVEGGDSGVDGEDDREEGHQPEDFFPRPVSVTEVQRRHPDAKHQKATA